MAEIMTVEEEGDFMNYIVAEGFKGVGAKRLELICSSFFSEPPGHFNIKSDSLFVQTYGLFSYNGNFFYGEA